MDGHLSAGGFDQANPFSGVGKQAGAMLFQVGRVADLDRRSCRQQLRGQSLEILHVRPEEHRRASGDRLRRILATHCAQTFPDENQRGQRVPVTEFAGRVEQQHVRRRSGRIRRGRPQRHPQTQFLQVRAHPGSAFHVARSDDQEQVRERGAEMPIHLAENSFLTRVGATRQENRSSGRDAQCRQQAAGIGSRENIRVVACGGSIVEFDAAGAVDTVIWYAELLPAGPIVFLRDADQVQQAK